MPSCHSRPPRSRRHLPPPLPSPAYFGPQVEAAFQSSMKTLVQRHRASVEAFLDDVDLALRKTCGKNHGDQRWAGMLHTQGSHEMVVAWLDLLAFVGEDLAGYFDGQPSSEGPGPAR